MAPLPPEISAAFSGILSSLRKMVTGEPALPEDSPLELLRAESAHCTSCPLAARKSGTFHGEGVPGATVLVVAPPPYPVSAPDPSPTFSGVCGALLLKMLSAINLSRHDLFLTHAARCGTAAGPPPGGEAAPCLSLLERETALIAPRLVLALGTAAGSLLAGEPLSLPACRGRWYSFRGLPLAVIRHPEELLADPSLKREAWEDLQVIGEALTGSGAEHRADS